MYFLHDYENKYRSSVKKYTIITAGSTYLDIDAYACIVAMTELLTLKGENVIGYSKAPCNYSVCDMLKKEGQIFRELPQGVSTDDAKYIIVDVSDPDFLKSSVYLDNVIEIYDHHVGFESFWTSRIGAGAHIEFIGAAATLIYREWKRANKQDEMSPDTAKLLVAAILDNTLNLTSANTTKEDVLTFNELCRIAKVDEKWCDLYFSEVQKNVESDLKNALFGDIKTIKDNDILPSRMSQICLWDAEHILDRLPQIRKWFANEDSWMINVIDIKHRCNYFLCDSAIHQCKIEKLFEVKFEAGVAKTKDMFLRKEIIKRIHTKNY